ncbi:E3 ubiquitin-protein ligase RSL1 [Cardamine amara subsp. amara]|uniref:RBR-type E3 ubiquitin transferase n=1 Tax=Cardamine amara subsp. amara TaxID=228776 RepID=A0ABD0ZF37_CARAN
MASSELVLAARNDVKFAFRLAREAIVSQNSNIVDVKATQRETCTICLEETDAERMFFTDQCHHRHCFSCVKQFVEVRLLSGIAPTCLNDECKLEFTLETCSKVLTSKLIEMWKQKMKEDSIPAYERVYCPYPSCSMLMSKTDISSETDQFNVRSCVKFRGLFCIDCKVPSHPDLSCAGYKKLHPDPLVDDMKLKSLANDNM